MPSERLQQLMVRIEQFFAQVGETLQEFRWYITLFLQGVATNEDKIYTEFKTISKLTKNNPNAAYPRAVATLKHTQRTGNDELIMYCAIAVGYAAARYYPPKFVDEAISAWQLAIEKALKTGHDKMYAAIQNRLGHVYMDLPTEDQEANLHQAITAFENALRIYTEEGFPQEYAETQVNLGIAYWELLTGDPEANMHRAATITAFENALRIYTEEGFPQEYARTQYNLGIAYWDDRKANLRRAITAFENALRIYTEEAFPQEYTETQDNLVRLYEELPAGDRGANLRRAITTYENALRIYTEEAFPQEYARTQDNLGRLYEKLPAGDRGANLRRAITAFENALRVYTEADFSICYAMAQYKLGRLYKELPAEDRGANLHRAITAYENALRILSERGVTRAYAEIQRYLGEAYRDLHRVSGEPKNYEESTKCFETALRISENHNYWLDYYKTLESFSQLIEETETGFQQELLGIYFHLLNAIHSFLHEKYYETIQWLEKCLQQAKDSAYKMVTIYIYLAKAYQAIFEIQKAKWYWKDALNVAKHINNKYLLDFVSINLAQVEIQFGQIERAKERLHGISKDNGFAETVDQLLAACDAIDQQKQAFTL